MARLSVIAVATVLLVVACDKVPLLSPTGSTISLSIDKNILPVNGVATVTAVVTESAGTPVHNGTTVTFQTSLGRVEPAEAQTSNGKAVVTYHAGSVSGAAAIHAFSGSARTGSGNSSAGGVSVLVGSAAAGSVSVNVVPSTVPQNGGTVTVSARVLDTANNPLPNVAVSFAVDQGTLSSSTAVSDANGIAQTTLTTNRVTKVTARVGGATPAEFSITVVTAPTVTIAAAGSTYVVGVPVAFTVTPSAVATANPIQSVVVDFGDGTSQTLNGITGPFGLTHTYDRANGYTVTATATDINGQRGVSSIAIVVSRLLPTVTLTTNPASGINVGEQVAFTIAAAPATGGPPLSAVQATIDGVVVFSSSAGGTFVRSFGAAGTYVVEVTATDTAGSTGRTSTAIVVSP